LSGGKFQGSTTSSSSGYTDLYTIPATPPAGWNEVQITDRNSYRYLRFVAAVNVYCTIAEMEFYGNETKGLAKMTSVSAAKPLYALPAKFGLSAVCDAGNSSLVKVLLSSPVALGETRFDLYNLQGKCIETEVRHVGGPGYSLVEFNTAGRQLPTGNYICRAHAEGFDKAVMLLVR
jgi:hypothetical protein